MILYFSWTFLSINTTTCTTRVAAWNVFLCENNDIISFITKIILVFEYLKGGLSTIVCFWFLVHLGQK